MNRFVMETNAGKYMVCVLEPGNVHKLVSERKPIEFSLNDPPFERGLPAKLSIVIMFSETPIADQIELEKHLGAGATKIDSRTPKIASSRPHCPECHSTIEQLGVWRSDKAPIWMIFCPVCGCALGTSKPIDELAKK